MLVVDRPDQDWGLFSIQGKGTFMARQRTGGMTTIGVLSIILGSLGVLLALLVSLVGGLLAGAGSDMAGTGFVEGEQFGTTVAMGGSIILLIGIATLGINLMLLFRGVGVL